ncbi:MAG: glyoxalase [Longispora sp.]|nr:glyoxalase [Longispora sp. (in: high G+C Gram-positive bacteria)]
MQTGLMVFHHVQISCPAGSEETLRDYYSGLLGLTEVPKPPILAVRGGAWFRSADGSELHLGVEPDFRPARKAHPALLWPELDALAARLMEAGYEITWGGDEVPGMRRFHTFDPHGNRLEFLTSVATR